MLLEGARPNGQQTRIRICPQFLLAVLDIRPVEEVLEIFSLGRQYTAFTERGAADTQAHQKSLGFEQAEELANVLLEGPRGLLGS